MDIKLFDEPILQFGYGEHIDIRYGISNYHPFDFDDKLAPKTIKVGVIGTNETIEELGSWLDLCRNELPAKKSHKPKLFPKFCGFNSDSGFKSTFVLDSALTRALSRTDVKEPSTKHGYQETVSIACESFLHEIEHLSSKKPDVILCAPPVAMVEALFDQTSKTEATASGESDEDGTVEHDNFRRMLKASSMGFRIPLQIILPHTYNENVHYTNESLQSRQVQDVATRAWHLWTAIYYKAGGTPWRLINDLSQFSTCFIGIGFYKTAGGQTLQTSVAQVFNERGKGVIVRGGRATESSQDDRQPHLSEESSHLLLGGALQRYKDEHGNLPARVVIHKTSNFTIAEITGCKQALKEKGIEQADLLTIFKSDLRLYRNGLYPPLRGTKIDVDSELSLLYTRGSVQFYETYPGMYIPRALEVRSFSREQTMNWLCEEILSLTKMNWNNTQFDGGLPITLKCARQVGDILKYTREEVEIEHRYSFYM